MDNSENKKTNRMPPPWLMYPWIPQGSIGWRMGFGEYYMMMFDQWFGTLSPEKQVVKRNPL